MTGSGESVLVTDDVGGLVDRGRLGGGVVAGDRVTGAGRGDGRGVETDGPVNEALTLTT